MKGDQAFKETHFDRSEVFSCPLFFLQGDVHEPGFAQWTYMELKVCSSSERTSWGLRTSHFGFFFWNCETNTGKVLLSSAPRPFGNSTFWMARMCVCHRTKPLIGARVLGLAFFANSWFFFHLMGSLQITSKESETARNLRVLGKAAKHTNVREAGSAWRSRKRWRSDWEGFGWPCFDNGGCYGSATQNSSLLLVLYYHCVVQFYPN